MEEETERRFHSNDTRYAVGIILVTAFVLCSGLEWQVLKWITGREDEPARPNYTYYSGYHAGAHAPKGAYYHPEELTSEDLERCSLGIKGANFPRPYKPDPIAVQSGGHAWSGDGLRTEYTQDQLRAPAGAPQWRRSGSASGRR